MTTHDPLSRPLQPVASRIPKHTLEAAREVARHCFESAGASEAARIRPALAALTTGAVSPVQPSTR